MGARWMQQKLRKQQRMRRAWAKQYSRKNTGPDKYPITISFANGERSITEIGITGRSKVAKNYLNEHLLARYKFNPNSSEALYVRNAGLHSDLGGNELVLARLNQSRSWAGSMQKEQVLACHVCEETDARVTKLYMGGDINFFIGVRVTADNTVCMKSVIYADGRKAFAAWKNDKVLWDEIQYLPKTDPVLESR